MPVRFLQFLMVASILLTAGNAFAQKPAEKQKKAEEDAQAMERKRRYDAYWEAHAEEKSSLLAKREEATNALKSISGLATEERARLYNLITAIDNELKKER